MPVSGHSCPANRLMAMEAAAEYEALLDAGHVDEPKEQK